VARYVLSAKPHNVLIRDRNSTVALERRQIRLAALGTAITLGGGLALAGAAPAQAEELPPTSVAYVGAADIRPDESTYVGWHNGAAGSFVDGDDGLELTGKVQILNGFDAAADNGDLRDLVDAGIAWSSENAYFQIPLFFDNAAGEQQFTTLRPADAATQEAALDDLWTTSRAISDSVAANSTDTLEALLAAIEGSAPDDAADVVLLGYGLFVDADATGTAWGVKWDTELTLLQPAPVALPMGAAPVADSSELAAFLEEWGVVVADGGSVTQGDSLELVIDASVVFGLTYFDSYIYSAPVAVGVFQADENGRITVTLSAETLAGLAPGQHTLVLVSQESGEPFAVTFTVVAAAAAGGSATTTGATLAATGTEATLPIAGGLLLLVAGALLMFRRRAAVSA
jgi:LPXTG-motif cell wall-anchored protein